MPYPEVNMALAICCFLPQVAQCCPVAQNTQSLIAWPPMLGKPQTQSSKKVKSSRDATFLVQNILCNGTYRHDGKQKKIRQNFVKM